MWATSRSAKGGGHVWLPEEAWQAAAEAAAGHKRAGMFSLGYFGLSLARVIT